MMCVFIIVLKFGSRVCNSKITISMRVNCDAVYIVARINRRVARLKSKHLYTTIYTSVQFCF